ncbi:hypothetical protein GQ44DRAFT_715503 [Phaeosphaeriaceae sp. PMI808]|nr:hypothetical protein GQ44DRAFT_715503 [Phaeosphaeriaceae sp. PMI808]
MEPVYQGKDEVARMEGLEKIFSNPLLEYMETSLVRRLESTRENTGLVRITSAVSLYIVIQRDKDFKLEISLGSSIGNAISQELAGMTSPEYLKTLLGEYLLAGMMSSIQRNEEEKRGVPAPTKAVKVFFPTGNGSGDDCKLQVMLGYDAGVAIWYNAF